MAKILSGISIVILLAICCGNCSHSENAVVSATDTTGIQDTILVPADSLKQDSVK